MNTINTAAAPQMLHALAIARSVITIDRCAFHICNQQPDGSLTEGATAELAHYDSALQQINAAITLAMEGGAQ